MMVASMDDESVCIDNSPVDQPIMDEQSIELQIECTAISTTVVTLCIYLTDRPFIEGNGTYHTIALPLNLNCTGLYLCMCMQSSVHTAICIYSFYAWAYVPCKPSLSNSKTPYTSSIFEI